MTPTRKSSGSALLLLCLLITAFLFFALIGFSIDTLLYQRSCSQAKTDALSLALACNLNSDDRIGQLNSMQANTRELIFRSRGHFTQCRMMDLDFIEPLCDELLIEARNGNAVIEKERQNQVRLICSRLQEYALNHNREARRQSPFKLGYLQTESPIIERIELGSVQTVPSNVKANPLVTELLSDDKNQQRVLPRSLLFRADCNVKLPSPDSDLNFKFASLAPNIDGNLAPARNVNPEVFVSEGCIFDNRKAREESFERLPSAVQITCSMRTALGENRDYQGDLRFVSTAITNGAAAPSD